MTKWKRRLLWGIGVQVILGGGLWLSAPSIVRWQIHKRHPEVAFDSLDLGWGTLTLHNVAIDKGWLTVRAETAYVDRHTEAVRLVQGHADVDLDRRPTGGGAAAKADAPNVTVEDFDVTIEKSWPDENEVGGSRRLRVLLRGVFVDERSIKAADGSVLYSRYQMQLGSLGTPLPAIEASRDLSHVTIGTVSFPDGLSLPAPMPAIVHPSLSGIDVDIEHRTVNVNDAGFELVEDQAVSFHAQWTHLRLDGDKVHVEMEHAIVAHPWLAANGDNVDFQRVAFEVGRDWKAPIDVAIGPATLHVDPQGKSISGDEMCSSWAAAIPSELGGRSPLHGQVRWGENPKLSRLGFSIGLLPKVHMEVTGRCSATCDDDSVKELRHHFTYFTYDDKGRRSEAERMTGPETPNWVPVSQISDNMFQAVVNMEDFGFWQHHGFVPAALAASFQADVASGKFQRGGSTLTMQLAKNIWLSRDKTVGRKVAELFLSQVLESCFTKKEILELYLNVVEFGPNVYGLRQASAYYFHSAPADLSPQQAFYLAWILPRPRRAPPPNDATMALMTTIMRRLAEAGRISDTMLLGVDDADVAGAQPR